MPSSSSLSRVRRHLLLYPLPLNCACPEAEESATETATDSDQEEEQEEEQREEKDQPPTNISVLKKKKNEKHRKKNGRQQLESDEEESYRSVPRSEKYLHSQKHQRISNHPNYQNVGGRTKQRKRPAVSAATSKKKARNGGGKSKRDEDYEDDTTVSSTLASGSDNSGSGNGSFDEDTEAKRKWCESKLKEMLNLASEKRRGKSEMDKAIEMKAKHQLFKKTKFTHGHPYKKGESKTKLEKDSEWLLNHINPDDYRKFDDFPKLQQEHVECWVNLCKDIIRVGLNKKHNDIRSSILNYFADIPDEGKAEKWNPDDLPETGKEMDDLFFIKGFAKKDPKRKDNGDKLAAVTDLLMPKVRKSGA